MIKNIGQIFSVLVWMFCPSLFEGKSITELNVLLPFSREVKTSYLLEAFDGCYFWKSSNPHIINVITENQEKCSDKVLLRVEATEPSEKVIWVIATDSLTGEVIRVESRVDLIQRIEIITKLRTLEVGDFAILELMGFDSQGNAFSTLEGLHFQWNIHQESILAEFTSFNEANMQISDIRTGIELQSGQSDKIVMKGLQIGEVKVTATIKQDLIYKGINHSVGIYILEHFTVMPEEDLILSPCDFVSLKLFVFKKEKNGLQTKRINLPNSKFIFKNISNLVGINLSEKGLLTIDSDAKGQYSIEISTENRRDNRVEKLIQVSKPTTIQISYKEIDSESEFNQIKNSLETPSLFVQNSIQNESVWRKDSTLGFQLGKKYCLKSSFVDQDLREVYFGDSKKIIWSLPNSEFKILGQWKNYVFIEAIKLSKSQSIHVQEESSVNCSLLKLSMNKQYRTVSKVKIIGPFKQIQELSLPFFEGENQILTLSAVGGSGEYIWFSSNSQIISVDEKGTLRALGVGSAKISLSDKNLKTNKDTISVTVSEPQKAFSIESRKDLWIGTNSHLFIGLLDKNNLIFANCTSAMVEKFQEESLLVHEKDLNYNLFIEQLAKVSPYLSSVSILNDNSAYLEYVQRNELSSAQLEDFLFNFRNYGLCKKVFLEGIRTLDSNFGFGFKNSIQATVRVVVYAKDSIHLPNMYIEDVFGPIPIISKRSTVVFLHKNFPQNFYSIEEVQKTIKFENKSQSDLISAEFNISTDDSEEILLTCLKTSIDPVIIFLEFSLSRKKSTYSPLTSSHSIKVFCQDISFIRINHLSESQTVDEYKYLSEPIQKTFSLRNDHTHNFSVWAFDSNRRPFWNFTEINFEWTVSNNTLASLSLQNTKSVDFNQKLIFMRRLELSKQTGSFTLNCKGVVGGIIFEDHILINSINKLGVVPAFLTVYNHPSNAVTFNILNGSGSFKVISSDSNIAIVEYAANKRKFLLRPIAAGSVSIVIKDLEIQGQTEIAAQIEVVEVTRIEVVLTETSVEEGSSTTATVEFFAGEKTIPADQAKISPAVLLASGPGLQITVNAPNSFFLTSKSSFSYSIQANLSGKNILSTNIFVHFYEKLKIFPNPIILFKACKIIVQVLGGPSLESRKNANLTLQMISANRAIKIESISENSFQISSLENLSTIVRAELRSQSGIVRYAETQILIDDIDGISFKHPHSMPLNEEFILTVIPTVRGMSLGLAQCPMIVIHTKTDPQNGQIEQILKTGRLIVSSHAHFKVSCDRTSLIVFGFEARIFPEADEELTPRLSQSISKSGKPILGYTTVNFYDQIQDLFSSRKQKSCSQPGLTLPTDAKIELRNLNSGFSLSVLHNDHVLSLEGQSTIRTGPNQGLDLLIFRRKSEELHLSNAIPVQVSSPHVFYFTELDKASVMGPNSINSITLGLMDDFGRIFFSPLDSFEVLAFSSSVSVLEVAYNQSTNSLKIQAKSSGTATIQILARHYPQLSFGWTVNVGSLILPANEISLHIGAEVHCQISSLVEIEQNSAHWQISNQELLSISPNGLLLAVKPGLGIVSLNIPSRPFIEVFIFQADSLYSNDLNPKIISNIPSSISYSPFYQLVYELKAKNEKIKLSDDPLIDQNLEFSCKTNSAELEVKPKPGPDPQTFICEIRFKSQPRPSNRKAIIEVKVSSLKNEFLLNSSTELTLKPAFFLIENINSISTNPQNLEQLLVIQTTEEIDIDAGEVASFVRSQYNYSNKTQSVTIIIPRDYKKEIKTSINLLNRSTKQKIEIPFQYNPESSFLSKFTFSFATGADIGLVDIVIIGICLIIVYYIFAEYRKTKY